MKISCILVLLALACSVVADPTALAIVQKKQIAKCEAYNNKDFGEVSDYYSASGFIIPAIADAFVFEDQISGYFQIIYALGIRDLALNSTTAEFVGNGNVILELGTMTNSRDAGSIYFTRWDKDPDTGDFSIVTDINDIGLPEEALAQLLTDSTHAFQDEKELLELLHTLDDTYTQSYNSQNFDVLMKDSYTSSVNMIPASSDAVLDVGDVQQYLTDGFNSGVTNLTLTPYLAYQDDAELNLHELGWATSDAFKVGVAYYCRWNRASTDNDFKIDLDVQAVGIIHQ